MAEIMEGVLALDRSLRKEWSVGFENFPDVIKSSIPNDIAIIIEGIVADKKGWVESNALTRTEYSVIISYTASKLALLKKHLLMLDLLHPNISGRQIRKKCIRDNIDQING